MAKLNLLKDIEVKSAKITNKIYYLSDGGGLRLKVDVKVVFNILCHH
ncbi:Arm DNA-binding domain-containing protein [Aliarcobacter cryaerophilus]|nr:Arm DNA-binding domain-containing protein [Aliarcobacter cryaerophilus]MCT7498002.1 Arm DNA-binding domain-containing protein [Aliarcobacter cryaerophilus]